ncbi:MAG: hypothetical protein FJZ92_13820 [Chloroflexi bacterium]|nr:hypothetical protein [Chloroflexota bacterium]
MGEGRRDGAFAAPSTGAPFAAGQSFTDPASGTTLEVLGVEGAGYRVRVTPPGVSTGPGSFDRPILGTGVNTALWNGGSIDQLAAAASAGGPSVTVFVGGSPRVLVPGAPAFVNAPFRSALPGGLPAGTIVFVVR